MGSLWQSRAVYRKFTAVWGCVGESTCSLGISMAVLAVQGNVRRVCGILGKCVWNSRAVNGSIGDSTVV